MLFLSESALTSMVTFLAYLEKYITAWPAEFAPPLMKTFSSLQASASVLARPHSRPPPRLDAPPPEWSNGGNRRLQRSDKRGRILPSRRPTARCCSCSRCGCRSPSGSAFRPRNVWPGSGPAGPGLRLSLLRESQGNSRSWNWSLPVLPALHLRSPTCVDLPTRRIRPPPTRLSPLRRLPGRRTPWSPGYATRSWLPVPFGWAAPGRCHPQKGPPATFGHPSGN